MADGRHDDGAPLVVVAVELVAGEGVAAAVAAAAESEDELEGVAEMLIAVEIHAEPTVVVAAAVERLIEPAEE